ncbi:cysteine peptidase family C39 domain-containing protein [Helicobacter labetoulli]|uniref:cysteine peptidase family C39 domain-containing protein n=1 Tax=Helicobacter labetoulli TaxID=2315333 RepID=UPI001FC9E0F2|nr:cysteine peptidase family C39 domain-containing protein [Helicobacter labetoulli]
MFKSVSGKIAITIVALLVVSFILLALASFSLTKSSIVASVAHGKQESVKNAENFVNTYFESKLHFVEEVVQDIAQSGDFSYPAVAKRLEDAFRLMPHLDALYIGYESNGLLIKTDVQSKNKAYILDQSKGFRTQGLALDFEALTKLQIPVIIYVNVRDMEHFSVYKGADSHYVYLADPSLGNIKVSKGKFLEMFYQREDLTYPGKILVILSDTHKGNDTFFTHKTNTMIYKAIQDKVLY